MATGSTIEGVAELTKQLNALKALDDGRGLKGACRAGMKPAFEHAALTMPVGSQPHRLSATYGRLLVNAGYAKSTLKVITTINSDKTIASAIMSVKKSAYYEVKWVELGSRKMGAQPWIRNALLTMRSECEDAFKQSMQRSLDRAVAGA